MPRESSLRRATRTSGEHGEVQRPGPPAAATHHVRRLRTLEHLLAFEAMQPEGAMQHAAQQLSEVFGADKVDVFVHDPRASKLVAIGTSDTPMGKLQHQLGLDRLDMERGGRTMRVFQTGEAYLSRDAREDPLELRAIVEKLGVRSAMYAPISVGPTRRGVLLASSARPGYFTQEDLQFLQAVARWIGLVAGKTEGAQLLTMQAAERGYQAAAARLLNVLTPRQREIAALVTEGYSNAEIAHELVLVPGTVANHVEQILARLGARNRAEVAALVAETGLHRGRGQDRIDGQAQSFRNLRR